VYAVGEENAAPRRGGRARPGARSPAGGQV